ncbi:glycoside hydrolase family 127 protein [Microbacterium sp. NE2HP2]|uniref:beta-L-arabinofuranosidase domain-containing protein n=1 Tax=Microbacterium plantarum TaxID=1816425 RepID=UPI0023653F8F|nr:beta-L-arabinofuranosidase domain-containing protein [Microbacterium plantarum]MDD7945889.1 glycoside hydrolase family 127 protein [Microbacterium plantarum]
MTDAAPRALPFPYGAVRLKPTSAFAPARDRMLHLARVYPIDRLLAVFRAGAGLDTRGAEPPGAWEGFGHPAEEPWGEYDYPGREAAQTANLLRGHYAGHFLSMLALAAAGEDDDELRSRVDELVGGLAEVQQALAATGRYSHPGLLFASGEWQFARLEHFAPYGEIWAPYYTCHKLMAGLLDAYELAGNKQALEVVTGMAHWISGRLEKLDHDHRQRMWSLYIAGEFGGMNETLARLSAIVDEPRFLAAARAFDQGDLLEAGSSGHDILDGMHANQHLPQLVGYVREYELTGERRYLAAAIGVFDQVVPGRMYAHGGTGENELWGPPRTVAGDIGRRNAETCATYNLVKLAETLFTHTLAPRFLDYAERARQNHILGSRRAVDSDDSPEVTYMFPVHAGALPEYDNVGTCCGGTGLENHVGHQAGIFFRDTGAEPALWVARYTPAELRWDERGVSVEVDQEHPFADRVTLRVQTTAGRPVRLAVHLRVPDWVAGGAEVAVDGHRVDVDAAPGGFVTIDRTWRGDERIELTLPAALRSEPTIDDPGLRSLRYGPHALVARDESTTPIERAWDARRMPGGAIRADLDDVSEALAATGAVSIAGLRHEPVWNGSDERYHLYSRADDRTIGFAGVETGVPARRRADGTTLIDALWAEPAPQDDAELLDRLVAVCRIGMADSLVSASESRAVIGAGLDSGLGIGGASAGTADAARRARDFVGALTTTPDAVMPPTVDIVVSPAPAASGWFTAPPTVEVRAAGVTSDRLRLELRIDDGPWRAVDGPVVVDREGVVRLAARAVDADGRSSAVRRELAIDTEPPRSEARVKQLGAAVEITLIAADDVSGVDAIRWEGEGTFWATFQEAFVRALTDHEQVIEFAATDRAGNEEARRRITLPPASKMDTIAIALTSAPDLARSENDS